MSHQEHETGPPGSVQEQLRDSATVDRIRKWAMSRANWPGADREGFASEVICRLLVYEYTGKKVRNLNAFTAKVIKNAAGDEARKAHLSGTMMDSATIENILERCFQSSPDESFSIAELMIDLDEALVHVEESKREVLTKRIIDKLSQEETAELLVEFHGRIGRNHLEVSDASENLSCCPCP